MPPRAPSKLLIHLDGAVDVSPKFFLLEAGIVDRNQVASTCSGEQNTAVGCGHSGGDLYPDPSPGTDLIAAGRDDGRDDGL